jgi:hypothetical protein
MAICRFKRWEKSRSKGVAYFIFVAGAFEFGILSALLSTLVMLFTGALKGSFLHALVLHIVIFPIAGMFWGLAFWWLMEQLFQKHLEQATCPDHPTGA